MHGDFSRQTFDQTKHYTGVLMQQGRVQLDADANEQQAITQHRHETADADIVGPSGTPKSENGFRIGLSADSRNLTIAPGRYYVDGILCENERIRPLTNQPDLPFKQGNLAGFTLPTASGRFLAYLDVWQRHITALDDPEIKETALGGPDTTTRLKTVWQVRLLAVGASDTCAAFAAGWRPAAEPNGALKVSLASPADDDNLCVLPASGGFRRLENQLYRVEVQRGGPRAQATFKWSRDNGSVVTAISRVSGPTLTVDDIGRDAVLGFAGGQWVELSDDRIELNEPDSNGLRAHLAQIDSVNPATREIVLKAVPGGLPARPELDTNRHARLRRWDQRGVSGGPSGIDLGIPMAQTPLELEDGIVVEFMAGSYVAGDHWLIPARTAINDATGGIEWPRDGATGDALPQTRHGTRHHFATLALVDFDSASGRFAEVADGDCRRRFPALTTIAADDVAFDNTACTLANATNVQQALDELCQRREGQCTFVVSPRPGWEAVFEQLQPGQDAQICFQVGDFPLSGEVVIQGKGNLKISGCGPGTRIVAAESEAALVFDGCRSVTVRDLYAETGRVGSERGRPSQHLNGTLTFLNCLSVTVEHVELKCGAGVSRAAACITVRNDAVRPRPARISNCDLLVGHEQAGMLLVNLSRAQVEHNTIQVYAKPQRLSFDRLLLDKRFRAGVRRLLIGDLETGEPSRSSKAQVRLAAGNAQLVFMSDKTVARSLQTLLAQTLPARITTARALLSHASRTVDSLLLDRARRDAAPQLKAWFGDLASQNPAVAAQGIVVGGQVARDVHISGNTIQDVLQGIHIGLSNTRVAGVEQRLIAGRVVIDGNTIEATLPPIALRERYGIFVGNCDSLLVQDNYVRVQRFGRSQSMAIDGIRIYGVFGRMIIARQNHLVGCTTGVYMHVLNTGADVGNRKFQWLLADNMAPAAAQPVRVVEPRAQLVRQVENYA